MAAWLSSSNAAPAQLYLILSLWVSYMDNDIELEQGLRDIMTQIWDFDQWKVV